MKKSLLIIIFLSIFTQILIANDSVTYKKVSCGDIPNDKQVENGCVYYARYILVPYDKNGVINGVQKTYSDFTGTGRKPFFVSKTIPYKDGKKHGVATEYFNFKGYRDRKSVV